jgi:hypothetical protein
VEPEPEPLVHTGRIWVLVQHWFTPANLVGWLLALMNGLKKLLQDLDNYFILFWRWQHLLVQDPGPDSYHDSNIISDSMIGSNQSQVGKCEPIKEVENI